MWLTSGIIVGVTWFAKEIGALLLKDTASHLGKISYVREDSEVQDKVIDREGKTWDIHYVRRDGEPEHQLRFVAFGHLINESSAPLLLQDPRVAFWAEDGVRVRHVNPKVRIDGKLTKVVTIPAHGTVPIRTEVGVMNTDLATTYADAIPILQLVTTKGKTYQFPLSPFPMWRVGEVVVGWDSRRNKVVRAGTKEFIRAQSKGALGPVRGR